MSTISPTAKGINSGAGSMSNSTPTMNTTTYQPVPFSKPRGPLSQVAMVVIPPLVVFALFLVLYTWVRSGLEPHRQFLMPSGSELWHNAFALPEIRYELLTRALTTIGIALTGLAVSIPIGILLAVIMFRAMILERALFPNIVAMQSIPTLAIIPLIQTALGFGMLPKVLIVAKFTLFAIPITLLLGLKSVDRGIIDLFRLQGARWHTILFKACFPSAAPSLFAGLRIAASLAVISAIVSELFFLAGRGGLGQMIINSKIDFKYEQMYAGLITATLLSVSVYIIFTWLGNRFFAGWHESGAPQT
ncbi:NitT/TauT family transport system permease protein [Aquamicrobium aerolatum DSM 21857]|uniref:NitT/TauT family transport system permease protein n=2 Tax=Aerobium TaxID=3143707 RepID=A0A1I3I4N8_9HYPH|nr:NitT/TauT family transport system permease protein [Aquamicrobium aerolatum DSM 21857]